MFFLFFNIYCFFFIFLLFLGLLVIIFEILYFVICFFDIGMWDFDNISDMVLRKKGLGVVKLLLNIN